MQWPTIDPFLFCVHHDDAYPKGNDALGPAASLRDRAIGSDFSSLDGWSMYHGTTVPGFPRHPHRGFETVTLARRGFIDHSDSLGATARFGRGDVQWMTAGAGIVHAEMFPLLDRARGNHVELFQIWLNLPRDDKMVPPYFTMLWAHQIPRVTAKDDDGNQTEITLVAGSLDGVTPPPPPPDSWAARLEADVAIWVISLDEHARWTLPAASGHDTARMLYLIDRSGLTLDGTQIAPRSGVMVRADSAVELRAGDDPVEVLLLQGRPIGEQVAQYGPFVMNDRAGIVQAFEDYQRTEFGGWPWPADDPVHARDQGRFARHADGRVEEIDT
jgi:redox-sensitive bicupin YhaK (pirin superfamily)